MIGTQAIIAYPKPDGTIAVFTSPVTSYRTQLRKGNLSFPVSDISASFFDNQVIIYEVIELPENTTSVSHVWQDGLVSGNSLGMHQVSGNHLQSMGNLNLSPGQTSASHGGGSKPRLKIVYGVLNTVSWGIMIPTRIYGGKVLEGCWAKSRPSLVLCPLGMAGGANGLYLGIKSSGVHHSCHMDIGITLFCLGLLQVSALILRPAKDHKFRNLWNWFHHLTGYTVLPLSFANIWVGFYILKPAEAWIIMHGVISGAMIVSSIALVFWKRLTRDGNTIGANETSASSRREDNKAEIV